MNNVITLLENVDFNKVEYVFLAQGLNDYMSQIPITLDKNNAIYSYEGALIEAVKDLKAVTLDTNIVILSPTYNAYMEEEKDGTRELEYSFFEYVSTCERVAKEYGVEFINMYEVLGIDKMNAETYYYSDYIHLNPEGRKLYASVLVEYIKNHE
jgi:lysophospholipase L1-like esterase